MCSQQVSNLGQRVRSYKKCSAPHQEHIRNTLGTRTNIYKKCATPPFINVFSIGITPHQQHEQTFPGLFSNQAATHQDHIRNTLGTHTDRYYLREMFSNQAAIRQEHIRNTHKQVLSYKKCSATKLRPASALSAGPKQVSFDTNKVFFDTSERLGTHWEHIRNTRRTYQEHIRNTYTTKVRL